MLTLSKIASEIGVCKTTVSLVLNGKAEQARISEKTVKKVRDYCAKVNYLPNIHARLMCCEVVRTFLVLLNLHDGLGEDSSFSEYNVTRILSGISETANAAGFNFGIRLFRPDMDDEAIFNSFRNREFDGMIYYGLSMPEKWVETFTREKRRIIGIGIETSGNMLSVNIDNREISRKLTRRLLAQGRKKFLYLAGTRFSYPGRERYAGFREALAEAGVAFDPDSDLIQADFNEATARTAVAERIAAGERPDAIVSANDKMALGAMTALKEGGIRIPEEIAVAGGDNIEIGRYVEPGLTTFDNRAFDQGTAACQLLLDVIEGKKARSTVLQSELVVRKSA